MSRENSQLIEASASAQLGVFLDPSLPSGENLAGDLAVSTCDSKNVESLVIAENDQAKATVDGLNVGEINALFSKRVLNVDALSIESQSWAPKHDPSGEAEQHQNGYNAQTQTGYNQVHNNRGGRKNPNQKSSELIRRRPEFIRRHLVILTDKVQVCA